MTHCVAGRREKVRISMQYVSLPDGPPGGLGALFWAAGLLNLEAGTMLPFVGAAAGLE